MDATSVISEVLNRPLAPLSSDKRLNNIPEFDSVTLVSLVVRLETIIGRQLSENEMEGLLTVKNVEDVLRG